MGQGERNFIEIKEYLKKLVKKEYLIKFRFFFVMKAIISSKCYLGFLGKMLARSSFFLPWIMGIYPSISINRSLLKKFLIKCILFYTWNIFVHIEHITIG